VPAALPRHNASLLRLLLAQLAAWAPAGQLELSGALQRLVFHSSVALLFGPRFLGPPDELAQPKPAADGGGEVSGGGSSSNGGGMRRADRLRQAFFAFEAGFELAASPVPHALQPSFLAARRRLLAALRCVWARAAGPCPAAGPAIPSSRAVADRRCRACHKFCLVAPQLTGMLCSCHVATDRYSLYCPMYCRESYLAGHFEGTVAGSLIEVRLTTHQISAAAFC
jgi:hypothetical protein